MSFFGSDAQRLGPPPGQGIPPALQKWLSDLARIVNTQPRASFFSGTDPNSNVTGLPGDIVVNVGSASTNTRIWTMGGSGTTERNSGWVAVRVLG